MRSGLLVVLACLLLASTGQGAISPAYDISSSLVAVAESMASDPNDVLAARLVVSPLLLPAGKSPIGTSSTGITPAFGVPAGDSFGILSSGDVSAADQPNAQSDRGYSYGVSHNGANDVTTFAIDLQTDMADNCLGLQFQFLSEEFPEYVGSEFNDAFLVEIDATNWAIRGASLDAPNNIAFDTTGQAISINAAGAASMRTDHARGSTYDGATPALHAKGPMVAGATDHTVYLTIFDASDYILDSAVFVDAIDTWEAEPGACEPGIDSPEPEPCTQDCDAPCAYDVGAQGQCDPPCPPQERLIQGECMGPCEDGLVLTLTGCMELLPPNLPPTIDVEPFVDLAPGDVLALNVTATDPEGDLRSVRALFLPDGAWISQPNATTLVVHWTPKLEHEGVHGPFPFVATDGHNQSAMATTTIRVMVPALDADRDGIQDLADNCPAVSNRNQSDVNNDGTGDACTPIVIQQGAAPDVPVDVPDEPACQIQDCKPLEDAPIVLPPVAADPGPKCPACLETVDVAAPEGASSPRTMIGLVALLGVIALGLVGRRRQPC